MAGLVKVGEGVWRLLGHASSMTSLARTAHDVSTRHHDMTKYENAIPAAIAAPWFVGAALGLDILGTFYVGSPPFMAARLPVQEGGGLDGLSIEEMGTRTRVVSIVRAGVEGRLEHPPRRTTRLHAGDRAYVIGQYEELLDVLQRA